jgi:hypothetical protein
MSDIWIAVNWERFGIQRRKVISVTQHRVYFLEPKWGRSWMHKSAAFDTLEAAMDHANMLRAKKIAWHRSEIQRLESLEIKIEGGDDD